MLIGYARVSTQEQILDLQLDALLKAGVLPDDIHTDKVTGSKDQRPGLALALKRLREGDSLVVWRLDRLGRSVRHLLKTVEEIQGCGAAFRSLTEQVDMNSGAMGKLVFHIFAAIAQFESDVTKERTREGMNSAKERGRVGGRRHYVQGEKLLEMKRAVLAERDLKEIAAENGIKIRTLFNYVPGGREGLLARIAAGDEPQP